MHNYSVNSKTIAYVYTCTLLMHTTSKQNLQLYMYICSDTADTQQNYGITQSKKLNTSPVHTLQ